VDLHSHILYGLDDGAQSLEESLEMAREAISAGIRAVVCTPHYIAGSFENDHRVVIEAVSEFRAELARHRIPLEVFPGAELRIDFELLDKIRGGRVMSLNDTGRFVLVEAPNDFLPDHLHGFFRELLREPVTPVLAHPERNFTLVQRPEVVFQWVQEGVLVQITSGSLLGTFGREIQKLAFHWLRRRLVHLIASDAHDLRSRQPRLAECVPIVERLLGAEWAERIFVKHPRYILDGLPVPVPNPLPPGSGLTTLSLWRRVASWLGDRLP
jgi:protein-tyrosine phosphatase